MSLHPPAYELDVDFTDQKDSTCVLHMVPWSKWGDVRWAGTEPLTVPNPITYRVGSKKVHALTDFPDTRGVKPVLSKRMLDVLIEVRPFGYRLYPVEIRCRGQVVEAPSPALTYWLVQLTEHFDGFDPDRSDWEPSKINPERIGELYRLELKIPAEGLPSIFRIPQRPTTLFTSAEGREALLAAGVRGLAFKSCLELESQNWKQTRIASGRYRPPPTTRPT